MELAVYSRKIVVTATACLPDTGLFNGTFAIVSQEIACYGGHTCVDARVLLCLSLFPYLSCDRWLACKQPRLVFPTKRSQLMPSRRLWRVTSPAGPSPARTCMYLRVPLGLELVPFSAPLTYE